MRYIILVIYLKAKKYFFQNIDVLIMFFLKTSMSANQTSMFFLLYLELSDTPSHRCIDIQSFISTSFFLKIIAL